MVDGREQSDQTQLLSINYTTFVSEKKPKSSPIKKYLFKNAIDIQDGLLQVL